MWDDYFVTRLAFVLFALFGLFKIFYIDKKTRNLIETDECTYFMRTSIEHTNCDSRELFIVQMIYEMVTKNSDIANNDSYFVSWSNLFLYYYKKTYSCNLQDINIVNSIYYDVNEFFNFFLAKILHVLIEKFECKKKNVKILFSPAKNNILNHELAKLKTSDCYKNLFEKKLSYPNLIQFLCEKNNQDKTILLAAKVLYQTYFSGHKTYILIKEKYEIMAYSPYNILFIGQMRKAGLKAEIIKPYNFYFNEMNFLFINEKDFIKQMECIQLAYDHQKNITIHIVTEIDFTIIFLNLLLKYAKKAKFFEIESFMEYISQQFVFSKVFIEKLYIFRKFCDDRNIKTRNLFIKKHFLKDWCNLIHYCAQHMKLKNSYKDLKNFDDQRYAFCKQKIETLYDILEYLMQLDDFSDIDKILKILNVFIATKFNDNIFFVAELSKKFSNRNIFEIKQFIKNHIFDKICEDDDLGRNFKDNNAALVNVQYPETVDSKRMCPNEVDQDNANEKEKSLGNDEDLATAILRKDEGDKSCELSENNINLQGIKNALIIQKHSVTINLSKRGKRKNKHAQQNPKFDVPKNIKVKKDSVLFKEQEKKFENEKTSENIVTPENKMTSENRMHSENIVTPENKMTSDSRIKSENIVNHENIVSSDNGMKNDSSKEKAIENENNHKNIKTFEKEMNIDFSKEKGIENKNNNEKKNNNENKKDVNLFDEKFIEKYKIVKNKNFVKKENFVNLINEKDNSMNRKRFCHINRSTMNAFEKIKNASNRNIHLSTNERAMMLNDLKKQSEYIHLMYCGYFNPQNILRELNDIIETDENE